jgi:catechol 2,3-dioxygenase-like lactoylglutathione lyase family enzyme
MYSKDAEADRAFLRDVLGFSSVDAGRGWLIFALPPGEVAIHPDQQNDRHELYFMCDDLRRRSRLWPGRASRVRKYTRKDGVHSLKSRFRAEAGLAFISPNTRWLFRHKGRD